MALPDEDADAARGAASLCGTLFPALGFVNVFPFRYSFVADHFQYLASMPILARDRRGPGDDRPALVHARSLSVMGAGVRR